MTRLLVPAAAAEVDELLARAADPPVLLAGGTDLLVQRRAGRDLPSLVDLTNLRDAPPPVAALPGGVLRLSATRPLADLAAALVGEFDGEFGGEFGGELGGASDGAVDRAPGGAVDGAPSGALPAVRQAISVFASAQIRNRASIGGNLGTASPSGDLLPPLVAAGATVRLRSAGGRREVPITEFLLGPRHTDLRPAEWIETVDVATPRGTAGFGKLGGRRALAISVVNLAWRWSVTADGTLTDVRLAVGAAAPTVIRCPRAEGALVGRRVTRTAADEAAAELARDLAPIDDLRGSADYRRAAAGGLLVEALLPLCRADGVPGPVPDPVPTPQP